MNSAWTGMKPQTAVEMNYENSRPEALVCGGEVLVICRPFSVSCASCISWYQLLFIG